MPLDPRLAAAGATKPQNATLQKVGDLEKRVRQLERGIPLSQVPDVPALPTGGFRDGAMAYQEAGALGTGAPKIWLMVNGAWKYVELH